MDEKVHMNGRTRWHFLCRNWLSRGFKFLLPCTALGLTIVLIVLACIWIRSYQRLELFYRLSVPEQKNDGYQFRTFASARGLALFSCSRTRHIHNESEARSAFHWRSLPEQVDIPLLYRSYTTKWHAPVGGFAFAIDDSLADPVNPRKEVAIVLPMWFLCSPVGASLAILLTVWRRRLRRSRRKLLGLCVRCGYDVRASPLQCPECGAMLSP